SETFSIPPLSPSTSFGSFAGTAVVTNTRSPQTIGLECPTPGTSAFQRTFRPVFTSQSAGSSWPSAMPRASGPRNDGHSGAMAAVPPNKGPATQASATRIRRPPEADRLPVSILYEGSGRVAREEHDFTSLH